MGKSKIEWTDRGPATMQTFEVFGKEGWHRVRGYVVSSEIAFGKNTGRRCPWTITHLPSGLAIAYLCESCLIEQVAFLAWQIAAAPCDWSAARMDRRETIPQMVHDYVASIRWSGRTARFPEMPDLDGKVWDQMPEVGK